MYFKNIKLHICCFLLLNCWLFICVNGYKIEDSSIKKRDVKRDTSIRVQDDDRSVQKSNNRPYECYVCSWSIMGKMVSETSNNTDICSTGNFVEEATATTFCEFGCQTRAFRNSKKEDIRYFYRNCLKPEKDKEVVDKCYKMTTDYGLEERCECLSKLCNGSSSINFQNTIGLFLAFIPFFLISRVNLNLFP